MAGAGTTGADSTSDGNGSRVCGAGGGAEVLAVEALLDAAEVRGRAEAGGFAAGGGAVVAGASADDCATAPSETAADGRPAGLSATAPA